MAIKSNTPAEAKDSWQTPLWLFDALDLEFGFWLDAAASKSNALCAKYLTEEDNALGCEWKSAGAIWCNPPYSKIGPWVTKAAEQSERQVQTVVMLVPEDMSVGWFSDALKTVDEVRVMARPFTGAACWPPPGERKRACISHTVSCSRTGAATPLSGADGW